ncbi:hypothetical protein BS78_03G113400 [Paspalum vaginatum]|nr:hypothetical protein BS78_03G113400 [Paspalum vaginatum]
MSSPRRGGGDRTSSRAGFGDNDGSRARGAIPGHERGAGELSFGSAPAPWFAFAPPHPWAALERAHAPVFAQLPNNPFPWNMPPVLLGRPIDAPSASLMPPWAPPHEVPFVDVGYVGGGTGAAAPSKGNTGEPSVFPVGGGSRSVPVVASCLPLVRQCELLCFLGSPESLHELHRAPATSLVGTLRGLPQTSFACGVWVDRGRALVPEFMDTAASRYAAVAEAADFASEPEAARHRVNAFVGEATRGLIADVLPPGSVDSSTVLVLANALYFKGGVGAAVRPVDDLRRAVPCFKALKLPYNDGGARDAAFYMLLLLPDGEALEIGGLYDKAVSTPGFIGKHTPVEEVLVGRFMVPKFKFTFEFEASQDMQDLGVTRAFGGGDFSGMVTGGDGLFISGVYHKATIEVDELGTVAAASTGEGS